jgi:hypothetical protein
MSQTFGKPRLRYYSFILALWQEADEPANSHASWRFSLEDPHTAERMGFKSIDELARYLHAWAQQQAGDKLA